MSLITPDLTGTNVNCRVVNDARMIIKDNQVVEFNDSVFSDSLDITLVGTVTKKLVRDLDWAILDSDIDYEAMSAMRLREPKFKSILVKSVTFIKTYVADYKVSMTYQRLYPLPSTVALKNYPTKVEFTPEAWIEIVESVRRHELLLAPISDIHADSFIKQPMLLEPDPLEERDANNIVDEIYTINVPNKVQVIHPIHGAFFKDSLVVRRQDTVDKDILVEGEDYIVYGYDSYKTGNSVNTSGVYKFILFLKPYVCDVAISYHAYGGDPSLYDIKAHDESINTLTDYILHAQLLTAETVSNAPVVMNIINKISSLEEEVRRLARLGRPNYGDATNGQTLLKKISATDTDLHWWTIAELYKVSGVGTESEVYVSGTMKINVETLLTKFAFTAYVAVNLENEKEKLHVTCPSSICPLGYVPYEDYKELDNIIRPQFRIIWNQNAVQESGIYLQIGMRLKTEVTETIAVEDVSGYESCWKLIPSPEGAVGPEDKLVNLPSGNHVWDAENVDSRSETYLVPLVDGNIIWAGTEAMNRPSSGRKDISLQHFLEDEVDISRIRRVRLDMEEVDANRFPIYMDFIPGSEDLLASNAFYYNGKPAYITTRIKRNPVTSKIELTIGVDITAGLSSTELDLKQVIIYT